MERALPLGKSLPHAANDGVSRAPDRSATRHQRLAARVHSSRCSTCHSEARLVACFATHRRLRPTDDHQIRCQTA